MSWRIWSVSTIDWSTKVRVIPASFTWARALNTGKTGTASFALGDPVVAETATDDALAEWARMLVAEYKGLIVYAGIITGGDYDADTQTRTVEHADIFALFGKRIVANQLNSTVKDRPLVYTGISPGTMVKQGIYEGQNDAARYNLPIALPADVAGTMSKTIQGWDLPTSAEVIGWGTDTEGGPDIDLFPRWYGDGLFQWLLRMGDLSGDVWEWDLSAPDSPASGLQDKRDGSRMANRLVAVGNGTEKDMLLSVVDQSASSSFMPLDVQVAYKDEKIQANLDARARADLAARSTPTRQASMDVVMGADFAAHQLRLGGTVNYRTQGDPYFGTGWHSSKLIEFSGDLSEKIHLEFQGV